MQLHIVELAQKLLVPPGLGVYTVHTARERKDQLHQKLYGTVDPVAVEAAWFQSLTKLLESNKQEIAFLGIPSDCGGGILRGANWGPLALRNIFQGQVADLGDIRVIPHYLYDSLLSEKAIQASRYALYGDLKSELPVSPLSIAEYFLEQLYAQKNCPLIFGLGGDHSVSYPLVKTYLQARKKQGIRCALIHFDAHTDMLASRLGVEICFGSWVYHILQFLNSPSDLYQIGIRASGKEKSHWEKTYGIHQYWNSEIQKDPANLATHMLKDLEKKKIKEVYVSFDIDVLDRTEASATGTPEPNGLTTQEAMTILQTLMQGVSIGGADLVEVAPFVHHPGIANPEPQTTLKSATEIMTVLTGSY